MVTNDATPGQDLRVERDGPVVTLVLDRSSRRNALSPALRIRFAQAVQDIEADRTVRAVVLRGAGEHFCAGGDVQAMSEGDAGTAEARLNRMRSYHALIIGLSGLDRPVVAAVDGVAFGAGFGLALLADVVIASSRARFCMAFQRFGLVSDFGATYSLPRIVGVQRAKELLLTAREISAQEAKDLGIVLEVVADDRLHARADSVARAFADASPLAVGMTKRMLNASLGASLPQMLEMESVAQSVAATSDYAKAAFQAFAAKAAPPFRWP